MKKKILNRLLSSIVVLLGVTVIAFLIVRIGNADPAQLVLPSDATVEEIEAQRELMGLNQPILKQYFDYLTGLLRGDLGYSYKYNMPVTELIAARLPNSMKLAGFAFVLGIILAFILGMTAGTHKGSILDVISIFFAILGQALSPVWVGLVLILVFGVHLNILPTYGMGGFKNYLMPAFCMTFITCAMNVRLLRSGMIDILDEDFITATRARGCKETKVNFKFALRNAIIPVITTLPGNFGSMVAGNMVVETIFGWPGMGSLMITAINMRDYQLVQSLLLLTAIIHVLANVIADVLYTVIDPRMSFN